jgi:hypothetical protein
MTFDNTKAYTIQCKSAQNQIELQAIIPLENWFKAKVVSQHLSDFLQQQFNEVEQCIKTRNFKQAKRLESEILAQEFKIKELGHTLSEIQMGKKNTIYFKIG